MRKMASIFYLSLCLSFLLGAAACQRSTPPAEVLDSFQPTPAEAVQPPQAIIPLAIDTSEAAYRDPQLPVEQRVEDLLSRMTLAEKIGQMTQVEKNSIDPADITRLFIGSLLSGGGGYPIPNTVEAWAEMVDGFQAHARNTRLGIPLLYGVDAIHGHGNLKGATIFPHNIGLGATRDAGLVERIGRATGEEMVATGIRWNFAPVVAVPQDIRWGRTYEGFGEDTDLVTQLGTAYLLGLQKGGGAENLSDPTAVLATPKHFIGDGSTTWGTSTTGDYQIDRGDMQVDEAELRRKFLPPYQAAVEAGARSVMVSFSSWNGTKMHAEKTLLAGLLKGELVFPGFLVSDWQAIDELPGNYYSDVVTSVNAGLDMIMVPEDHELFIQTLQQAVENGDVPLERIDEAVRRILRVKFEMGLFERPFSDPDMRPMVGSEAHRQLAREAVAKSAVLLKNDHQTLPLAKDASLIFVAGGLANDIGGQSGGWTIEWGGLSGPITPGTTVLEAVQQAVDDSEVVHFSRYGRFDHVLYTDGEQAVAEVGIVVIGEAPYAEGVGDRADLALDPAQIRLIQTMSDLSSRLVVVLISGRPLVITEQLGLADAWVAAWLPGTEAGGLADVLFGDRPFTGRLPYSWPRSNGQLPFDFDHLPAEGCDAPLFPFGYGIATGSPPVELPDCPSP